MPNFCPIWWFYKVSHYRSTRSIVTNLQIWQKFSKKWRKALFNLPSTHFSLVLQIPDTFVHDTRVLCTRSITICTKLTLLFEGIVECVCRRTCYKENLISTKRVLQRSSLWSGTGCNVGANGIYNYKKGAINNSWFPSGSINWGSIS